MLQLCSSVEPTPPGQLAISSCFDLQNYFYDCCPMAEEEVSPSSPPSPWVRPGAPLPRIPRSYAEDANSPLHVACYTGAYNEALMLLLSGHEV